MVIKQIQISNLNSLLLENFTLKFSLKYYEHGLNIRSIINEAIMYNINTKAGIENYIKLYVKHTQIFNQKPDWMLYILSNDYEAIDKINFISNKLIS